MAEQKVSVSINAKDNTKTALDGIKKNLGGLSSAAKSFTAIFAAEKIKQFFTDSLKAGAEADAGLKKSFTQIGDAYRGFQVATAKAFLGNESLMSSLKSLILSVGPAVIKSFMVIVNTVLLVVNGYRQLATVASIAWNAIRGKDNGDNYKTLNELAAKSAEILANYRKIVTSDVTITPVAAPVKTKEKGYVAKDTSKARAALANQTPLSVRSNIERGEGTFDPAKRIDIDRDTQSALTKRAAMKQDALDMLAEIQGIQSAAESAVTSLASTLAQGISNAFAGAFSGGNIGSVIKDFGKVLLSGLGSIFTQLGTALINFGALMTKLKAALTSVLTSGPASIAIGVALLALGGVLNGIANGGGARGVASYNSAGTFSSNTRGISEASGNAAGTIVVAGGFLDLSNPQQAKAFGDALATITGRRINIQRG